MSAPVISGFMFPAIQSTVLFDPAAFFSPNLLSDPLPTNSFFQNLALKNGDQPEYIHPYLVKSANLSLSVSFPARFFTAAVIWQAFVADLTISAAGESRREGRHVMISSFRDLSVTLDFPGSNLQFLLARGSPYITFSVSNDTPISISTVHEIISLSPNPDATKYTVKLNNTQTWLVYASAPIKLDHTLNSILSGPFSGVIRVAVTPNPESEPVLDKYNSAYPVSGDAELTEPFRLSYKWQKGGSGDLLMLAHPLHVRLLSRDVVTVIDTFKYTSIDGELVGVIGDTWLLNPDTIPVTWHSVKGAKQESHPEILDALVKDVAALTGTPVTTASSYFAGKLVARAARLALIAEEVNRTDLIPAVIKFLKDSITPWLDGTFAGNGFLYESKYGGLVTRLGSVDAGADFGFGLYNDHHFHIGYFIYGIAVLAKLDQAWGQTYRPQAYSLLGDFLTLERGPDSVYPRLRNFDLYKLHSWAGGVTEFGDGRNQESTSEAVNAYYSATLMGMAYGDANLTSLASTLLTLEILATQTWWHVKEGENMYESEFTSANKIVGIVWANKRDSGLWFAPPEHREIRLGIQVLPVLPVTEALFSNFGYVRELVNWTSLAMGREGVGEGWKGFVYALEGIYDKEGALEKIKSLTGHDDGNSLTNMLWWIHSRGDVVAS